MSVFDVPCPACGAQAGALCLSADILEGVKEIKGGHKARREAAGVGDLAPPVGDLVGAS